MSGIPFFIFASCEPLNRSARFNLTPITDIAQHEYQRRIHSKKKELYYDTFMKIHLCWYKSDLKLTAFNLNTKYFPYHQRQKQRILYWRDKGLVILLRQIAL